MFVWECRVWRLCSFTAACMVCGQRASVSWSGKDTIVGQGCCLGAHACAVASIVCTVLAVYLRSSLVVEAFGVVMSAGSSHL
jgi:hypothetical protein